jgi:hypothetical protein
MKAIAWFFLKGASVTETSWISFTQLLVNIVLGTVTVALFIQGQRDRSRVDENRSREQASKISLLRHEVSERTRSEGGGFAESWSIRGTNVTVRNDSDLPVTQVGVYTFQRSQWRQHSDPFARRSRYLTERVQFPQSVSQPFGLSVLPGEALVYAGKHLPSSDLVLSFTDGAGVTWVKTTFDGLLWRARPRPVTLRSKVTQWIVRTRGLGGLAWIIHTVPLNHATSRFSQTESGIPWSAHWVRFTWGSCPIGEPDPWELPMGAPPREWPYDAWIEMTRRHQQRLRRGPCGIRRSQQSASHKRESPHAKAEGGLACTIAV